MRAQNLYPTKLYLLNCSKIRIKYCERLDVINNLLFTISTSKAPNLFKIQQTYKI